MREEGGKGGEGTYHAVVSSGDERVELVEEDDTGRGRSCSRKDLSNRSLTLSNVLKPKINV